MEAEALGPYRLSEEERADIEAALLEDDVASDAEVAEVFNRYRR